MKKLQFSEDKKKKWENFWYYYKFHVLIGIFAVICIVVFIRDMVSKVEYDYTIAFVGDYGMDEETMEELTDWFQERGEDLNGDGEVLVQIMDYYIPWEGDPQIVMANQTKLTVDMQDAQSMIYFLSDDTYEKFKELGVFYTDREKYTDLPDCKAYSEIEGLEVFQDMFVGLRIFDTETKQGQDEELQEYYKASEELLREFIGE